MEEIRSYTSYQSELKERWIENLNGGGNHELLIFVKSFTPFKQAQKAMIQDIFYEGLLINIANNIDDVYSSFFYAFPKDNNKSPLEYFTDLYIQFLSQKGNLINTAHQRQFMVLKKFFLTASFIRLRLKYQELAENIKPAFITSLIVGDAVMRSYTYRRVNGIEKYIEIDFFTHGETPTWKWLNQLKLGQQVISQRERNEATDHLAEGKALLCGDETAFPAIASILENWQNSQPPMVLLEMRNLEDYHYFDDCRLPQGTKIHTFTIETADTYGSKIKHFLAQQYYPIEKVWGAFNTIGMKLLRQFFEQTYALTAENMVLRVYWKPNKK